MIWLQILTPLFVMILMLKMRQRLEVVLPAGAFLLALFFGMDVTTVPSLFFKGFVTFPFWNLFLVILFVMLLGDLMDRGKLLTRMAAIFLKLFGDNRIAAAASTGFIGFLPMPGGSLLSAPFVDRLVDDYSKEDRLILNYWYRHIWEYFFPLYSGMAWIITVMKIDPVEIFLWLGPMTIVMAAAGVPLLLRKKSRDRSDIASKESPFKLFFISWPILLSVTLSIAFSIPLLYSIAGSVILFLVSRRDLFKFVKPFLFKRERVHLFILVAGIIFFDTVVREAGVAEKLFEALRNVPQEAVIFTIPFIVGMLTGISVGFISIAFPILSPFLMADGNVDMKLLLLAYIGGFNGVMISPTHLCLIVTTPYFKTTLGRVYPKIVLCALATIVMGLGYYWARTALQ